MARQDGPDRDRPITHRRPPAGPAGRQLDLAEHQVDEPVQPQRLAAVIVSENAADLLALAQLIESGKVTPVVDKTYPLSQAPDAIRYMQHGHARGKIVITV